jgi:hypothetical protein
MSDDPVACVAFHDDWTDMTVIDMSDGSQYFLNGCPQVKVLAKTAAEIEAAVAAQPAVTNPFASREMPSDPSRRWPVPRGTYR